ncbi:MAG: hypothetical protein ABI835_11305 [Chloroflexota bacterium]
MIQKTLQAGAAFLLLLTSGTAVYALSELNGIRSQLDAIQHQVSSSNDDALWTVNTGSEEQGYTEWIGLYPTSTLYDSYGAPSLRFRDLAPDEPDKLRDFEIGFYRYGPSWYTTNDLIEFWIGDGQPEGGIFSVAGNGDGGGEIQVRNPADTDSIRLAFLTENSPVISTESGIALHFAAHDGLISDDKHTFARGIVVPAESGYSGQIVSGAWRHGMISVAASAVNENSLVLITPLSQPKGQWWVDNLNAGESFSVSSTAPDETMDFNWLIVEMG